MKRLTILLFAVLIAATNSTAQEIIKDDYTGDTHFVATDLLPCGDSIRQEGMFNYCIACLANGNHYTYEIVAEIGCKRGVELKANDDVLIRTFKGNVILATLSMNSTAEPLDGEVTQPFGVHAFITFSSHNEIKQVVSEGIKKIRIASNNGFLQREYQFDTTSKPLSASLELIDKAVARKKPVVIADGF